MEELKCSNCGSFNGTLVSDTQNRLLCNKCNQGLGLFNDNIILLTNSINYLKIEKKANIWKL